MKKAPVNQDKKYIEEWKFLGFLSVTHYLQQGSKGYLLFIIQAQMRSGILVWYKTRSWEE